jgi:LysR family transcriptional regulator (chromosome initiation inhibitor)
MMATLGVGVVRMRASKPTISTPAREFTSDFLAIGERSRMFDRGQLEAFSAVIQHGSFERAATVLNVTRGAVSQRIKALEEALATILVVRERPVVTTSAGEILLRHIRALKTLEEDILSAISHKQQDRVPVPIAIAVNTDSLSTWFSPLVGELISQYNIALEIISDDQDHTFRRLTKGEVLGCVSSEPDAVHGFEATPLGVMHYLCVATPEFKNRHFQHGLTIAAVLAAPALLFDRKDALHDQYLRRLFEVRVGQYTRHYLPSPSALLDGICAGLGYAMAPAQRINGMLTSGQLVELTPDCKVTVPLYWHHWKMESPLARALTQTITSHARETLDPPM